MCLSCPRQRDSLSRETLTETDKEGDRKEAKGEKDQSESAIKRSGRQSYPSDEGSTNQESRSGSEAKLNARIELQFAIPSDFDVVGNEEGTLVPTEHIAGADDTGKRGDTGGGTREDYENKEREMKRPADTC